MVAARCVEALQLRTEMVAHGGARSMNVQLRRGAVVAGEVQMREG